MTTQTTIKPNNPKTKNVSQFVNFKTVEKNWIIINLEDLVLGRVTSFVSHRLMGKHKPTYSPHVNCGDNVILINANKVHLTGNKENDKIYYHHTGFVGGIKNINVKALRQKNAAEIVKKAVKNMLKTGPLANKQIKKLYVYNDENHPHSAQQPVEINFKEFNKKNHKN